MSKLNPTTVHDEMRAYIELHHLDPLISAVVGDMLLRKPTNLVSFVINYLYKNYAEKVQKVVGHMKVRDTIRQHKDVKSTRGNVVLDTAILDSGSYREVADHYIKTCDLEGFFSILVETVLQKKPKEPYGAMVAYLCEAYPQQGKEAVFKIQRNIDVSDGEESQDSDSADSFGEGVGSPNASFIIQPNASFIISEMGASFILPEMGASFIIPERGEEGEEGEEGETSPDENPRLNISIPSEIVV
ncbi:hypothetical protein B484DRAFT_450595 [Ochromonadaceae sp. CCMP2298]|nr:hypothetical protein B484DRAFT_450595 [Ochromonadaceae sp. CCMP2298]